MLESVSGTFSFLTALPIDWLVFGGIVIIIALDCLRNQLGRAVSICIALPLAYVFFSLVAATYVLGSLDFLQSSVAQAGLFGALFIACYILVRRMGLDFVVGGMGGPVQGLIAGFATAVVFVCVWLQIPALNDWWTFDSTIQSVFAEQFRLFWLLGSYAALAFARG